MTAFARLLPVLALLTTGAGAADELHGAGATFPAPVYASWADAWAPRCGCTLRYDAVGSGSGVERVEAGSVDFGATDAPLPPAELQRAHLRQFPAVIGAVVPVVNIAGIAPGRLALDAATLSAIYRGRIRRWDDAAIARLNPGLALPGANITVVHREEPSGTTFLWSRYLAEGDAAWRTELGSGTTLAWPQGIGGRGNEGVASLVRRTRWAIGYVEYAYARRHGLADVALPAHDGPLVRAGRDSFEAAVAAARWDAPADLAQGLTNEPGARSWPIVGASFVLVPEHAARAARALAFFRWALESGAAQASALDYVPLPAAAARLVEPILQPAAR